MLKPVYEAESSAIIPQKNNPLGSFLGNIGLDLADLPLKNMSFVNNTNNVADFVSILKSRSVNEKIIKKLNLEKHPEIIDKKNKSFSATVEKLQKKVKIISPSPKESTLKVKVRMNDQEMAKKIVTLYFGELKNYLDSVNYLSAAKNRLFIGNQLSKTTKSLKLSEKKLIDYKKNNQTVSLSDEVKEAIKYLAELEAQQLSTKIELNDLSEKLKNAVDFSSGFNEEWQDLIKKMEISKEAVKSREFLLKETKSNYLGYLNGLPAKASLLAELERDLKVQTSLYLFFTQQYELAKIEEIKEDEPFKILDPAFVYSKPVFPRKDIFLIVGFIFGLSFGIFIAVIIEKKQLKA